MYASNYIFSKTFFTAWIVVAIIWLWCTLLVAGFYPIIDGRRQLYDHWRAWRSHGKDGQAAPASITGSDAATESVDEKIIVSGTASPK